MQVCVYTIVEVSYRWLILILSLKGSFGGVKKDEAENGSFGSSLQKEIEGSGACGAVVVNWRGFGAT